MINVKPTWRQSAVSLLDRCFSINNKINSTFCKKTELNDLKNVHFP